jgi:hypothetical protein
MKSIPTKSLKDAKTTLKIIDNYVKALDKFRDKANDTRAVLFSAGKNVQSTGNGGLRVFQNAPKGKKPSGFFTDIDSNGGFIVYRDFKLVIDKTIK